MTMKVSIDFGNEVKEKVFMIRQNFDMVILLSLERKTTEKIVMEMGFCITIDPVLFTCGDIDHVFKSRTTWFFMLVSIELQVEKGKMNVHGSRFTSIVTRSSSQKSLRSMPNVFHAEQTDINTRRNSLEKVNC